MGELTEKKNLTRRDFLKVAGLVGVAAQAIAIPALGYKNGASKESYTGWESFEGDTTQFFNRKPFELKGGNEEMYERFFPTISEKARPNMMTDMPPVRQSRVMAAISQNPDWKPEDGWKALNLGPDLEAYYVAYEKRGQDRFNDDVITQTVNVPAWIANHEIYDDHFALSLAYFGSWTEHAGYPPEITEPPEISDYQYMENGKVVDLRDVNKARDERGMGLKFKSPEHAAELIKKVAHLYGATIVGITTMNPDYVYTSIRGMGPSGEAGPADSSGSGAGVTPTGDMSQMEGMPVPEHWKFAIAIGVPHEWDQFISNPQYGDSLDAYDRVRQTGWKLANFLKRIGYASRWHCPPMSYDMVVTPIALQAGLGEWGRMACVISPELGGNVRLAVVTTELEMAIDKPVSLGITETCKECKICADICPSGSISFADNTEGIVSRGIEHWDINNSTCYGYWMESMGPIGCRLCIAACPYSRKDNWVHGIARVLDPIDPTGLFNDSLLWMQKTFFDAPEAKDYKRPPDGCFASYRPAPEWLNTEKWFDITPPDPHDLCK
jgi:reductive dehalogenase